MFYLIICNIHWLCSQTGFFQKAFKNLLFHSIITGRWENEEHRTEWGRNVTSYNENTARTSTFWKRARSTHSYYCHQNLMPFHPGRQISNSYSAECWSPILSNCSAIQFDIRLYCKHYYKQIKSCTRYNARFCISDNRVKVLIYWIICNNSFCFSSKSSSKIRDQVFNSVSR